MGHRSTKRIVRLAVAALAAPAIGFGYYGGNTEGFDGPSAAAFAGAELAYITGRAGRPDGGRQPDEERQSRIPQAAEHLFDRPIKGPRADRYLELTHADAGEEKRPRAMKASFDPSAMDITDSLPERRDRAAPAEQPGKADRLDPSGEEEQVVVHFSPLMRRTSVSAFLTPVAMPHTLSFEESGEKSGEEDSGKAMSSQKISRGLIFRGETETEYQARQRRCLATAIYFEARGEPLKGQVAVAQVVMNRVRSSLYPDTICGVVFQGQWQRDGCQFSFACDGKTDVPRDKTKWKEAVALAQKVTEGGSWLDDIGHATHYHANYVSPGWRRGLNRIKQIGQHIFYKVHGDQIDDLFTTSGSPDRGLALSGSG